MNAIRQTFQRNIILDSVRELKNHPTAEDVYNDVRIKCANISKGTVYRNLGMLSDIGEIKRIHMAGAPDRFDFTLSNHYHFLCLRCGSVTDVALPYFEDINGDIESEGYSVLSHDLIVKGICPECKKPNE